MVQSELPAPGREANEVILMTTKTKPTDPAAIIRELRKKLSESENEREKAVELAEKQRKKILELEKRVAKLEGVKNGTAND